MSRSSCISVKSGLRCVVLGSACHRAMLHADKAALENRTKVKLLMIRERELILYTNVRQPQLSRVLF